MYEMPCTELFFINKLKNFGVQSFKALTAKIYMAWVVAKYLFSSNSNPNSFKGRVTPHFSGFFHFIAEL